ncbi:DUF188 domain-containing protein [Alicyclobacillus cycloheptanicus]|jgi:uncharacterized protein YaiI (UPF0178 family)|uniref:Uncharacterized protein YaiI (UPF0178 family) n=1 Tax=Alicyclobacillus cycloheptanicus TaxID=1457 RepID=A0ABT9XHG8_9BACL|nr:DUF188 domain-containing protein [Alicyclobacillus cycloheptanicus]MDQ0189733.1 uncharacterized protein YaiI (UPF0178 family) [Alicyclobacillus cycloheptanicus]WDM01943.1 DUF188 domain-containing protein [Alicyclobacillus cycloheptanicus]
MTDDTHHDQPPFAVTILVDADATPRDCLVTVDKLAKQYHAVVTTVSSVNHQYDRPNHVSVDPHAQAVDMEIVRRLQKGRPFVVITQDYGLAALSLGYEARVVSPRGVIFTEQNIDQFLYERDLHARERRATGRSRGPRKRTQEDAQRFEAALTEVLEADWPAEHSHSRGLH